MLLVNFPIYLFTIVGNRSIVFPIRRLSWLEHNTRSVRCTMALQSFCARVRWMAVDVGIAR